MDEEQGKGGREVWRKEQDRAHLSDQAAQEGWETLELRLWGLSGSWFPASETQGTLRCPSRRPALRSTWDCPAACSVDQAVAPLLASTGGLF